MDMLKKGEKPAVGLKRRLIEEVRLKYFSGNYLKLPVDEIACVS